MATLEEQITAYIQNGVNSEKPVLNFGTFHLTIATEIWSPDIYNLDHFAAQWNLVFCGELDGEYVFRSKS